MLRIGGYRFSETEGILQDASGAPIPLRNQSMKVLAKLAAHANQIVSRDDLIRSAWEGRAIADDGVAQCIKDIRLP